MSDDDEEKRRDQAVRERKEAEDVWEERPGFVAKFGLSYTKLGVKISLVWTYLNKS